MTKAQPPAEPNCTCDSVWSTGSFIPCDAHPQSPAAESAFDEQAAKPCEHEAKVTLSGWVGETVNIHSVTAPCFKCGVMLKTKWEPVEFFFKPPEEAYREILFDTIKKCHERIAELESEVQRLKFINPIIDELEQQNARLLELINYAKAYIHHPGTKDYLKRELEALTSTRNGE